jgi:pilin isopeptide linkage protein/LPXTG-motif cell wall-anchored protein
MFYVSVLMLACFFFLSAATPVLAAGSEKVGLESSDAVSGTPFSVENMFPGDSVVQEYSVSVSHKEAVTLYYHADIRAGYEILAEVLEAKIELADKGITLYDGLLRDMPSALEYPLAAGEDTLRYRITISLDTGVGSPNGLDPDGKRYMNRELIADFRWWYLVEEPGEPGEPAPVYVKLTAEMTVDGNHPKGNDFTFQLTDEQGTIVQTKRNNGGLVEFDSLPFTTPGVYTLYISQLAGADDRIEYDDSVYRVTIVVREQDGVLTASVSYLKDGRAYSGTPLFSNANANISGIPQTGEKNTHLGLYMGLGGGALLILVLIKRQRERSE